MKRWFYLAYGVAAWLAFLGVYAVLAAFVGGLWLPWTIDGPAVAAPPTAVLINLLLVAAFAAQHSIMARPAFKQVWTRWVPAPIERSTYVWLSNAVVVLLMWFWQPWPTVLWDIQSPAPRAVLWVLFAIGWLAVPAVSLMIHHFDLFGVRQVWLYFQQRPYVPLAFRTPFAYGWVRHPLYVAWALAFWATPTMTAGHLLFALSLTIYMVLASMVEERDLLRHFGESYQQYRQQVPRFLPLPRGRAHRPENSAGKPQTTASTP
jgi:protein-S-isoprenylcysteine O-methyltransferase Ste14